MLKINGQSINSRGSGGAGHVVGTGTDNDNIRVSSCLTKATETHNKSQTVALL